MTHRILFALSVVAVLCSCGSLGQPMSPGEFREAVAGSSLASIESFDADRPYAQVVETLRKKANECLKVATTSSGTVFQGSTAVREQSRAVYTPTLTMKQPGMELAIQVDFGEHTTMQKTPIGGFYILVADAMPAGEKVTKLTIYRGSLGRAKEIGSAIRAWVTGASSTCPDLNG